MGFTLAQQIALAVLPKISGWISMILSGIICYIVLKDPKRRCKTYHRLVFGISLSDLSSSFWLALSTWPIPRGSGVLWAVGNDSTCKLQGFFTQVGVCSSFYNASLSIYFLLVVKYSWSDSRIRAIEPWLHGIPIAWALLSGFVGLGVDALGNATLWCWVKPTNDAFRWGAFYGPLWTMIVIITVSSLMLLQHVHRIERASDQRRRNTIQQFRSSSTTSSSQQDVSINNFSRDNNSASITTGTATASATFTCNNDNNNLSPPPPTTTTTTTESSAPRLGVVGWQLHRHLRPSSVTQQQQRQQQRRTSSMEPKADRKSLKRTRAVARQSFLFAGAFYLNWTGISIMRLLQTINHTTYYPLLVIAAFTVPIQGLPNFLVYLAPTFSKSKWWARLCQILSCHHHHHQWWHSSWPCCCRCYRRRNNNNNNNTPKEDDEEEEEKVPDPSSSGRLPPQPSNNGSEIVTASVAAAAAEEEDSQPETTVTTTTTTSSIPADVPLEFPTVEDDHDANALHHRHVPQEMTDATVSDDHFEMEPTKNNHEVVSLAKIV